MKTDYSKKLESEFRDFALQMHEDVRETLTVAFKDDEPSPHSLAKVLASYPAAYAFLVTQHRLIKQAFIQVESNYTEEYEKAYAAAADECDSKATQKAISAKVAQLYGDGLKKLKDRRDDLEQKYKLASDMLQVFDRSINALQSLGKLTSNEGFFAGRTK